MNGFDNREQSCFCIDNAGEELGIETEIKVKIEDAGDFCRRLEVLGASPISGRHFEDNHLLDYADQKLKSSRCLLRVRFAGDRGYLTFKGSPLAEGIFKTREELETGIEDGATLIQILERIGMQVGFRYQKYRREFLLDEVHVAVDETPIGNYVEFEGSENSIQGLAHRMGIKESQFLRLSYYSLYVEFCRSAGIDPCSMIF
ncbi:MAG: class IV adenylate cyclase [Acidobacteria bacterium]|nr:class IV adenylate cyclase [Acidobacteriota bacterium]